MGCGLSLGIAKIGSNTSAIEGCASEHTDATGTGPLTVGEPNLKQSTNASKTEKIATGNHASEQGKAPSVLYFSYRHNLLSCRMGWLCNHTQCAPDNQIERMPSIISTRVFTHLDYFQLVVKHHAMSVL